MQRADYARLLLLATVLLGLWTAWPRKIMPPSNLSVVGKSATQNDQIRALTLPFAGAPAPSFDIVRIEPSGTGAASGRGPAHARILLRRDGSTAASTSADERGEWALLITNPLKPGDHKLNLIAVLRDGRGIQSEESAIVSISEQPTGKPLVVLSKPGRAPAVMQRPDGPWASLLSVDGLSMERDGEARIGGRAEPGTQLQLYLDNMFLGRTEADSEGRWWLETKALTGTNSHKIRIDALASDQNVDTARVAQRFEVDIGPHTSIPSGTGADALSVEVDTQSWQIAEQGRVQLEVFARKAVRVLDPAVALPGQVPDTDKAVYPAAQR